jgi:hypothetical protein
MTKRFEGGAKFLTEEFRLFPGREVTAFVELVLVNQVGICPLGPTPRSLVQFVWEDTYGSRNASSTQGSGSRSRHAMTDLSLPDARKAYGDHPRFAIAHAFRDEFLDG